MLVALELEDVAAVVAEIVNQLQSDAAELKSDVVRLAERIPQIPAKGEKGEKGDQGEPGAGVDLDALHQTICETITLAINKIRPEMIGPPGRDGLAGLPGRDGKDGAPGAPGRDGLGFDDLAVHYDGERCITFRFVRGDQWKEFPLVIPFVLDRGVYRDGISYARGDAVTHGGCVWIAQDSTAGQPGNGSGAWRLAVKKGRDGKDGERGAKGERGETGKSAKAA